MSYDASAGSLRCPFCGSTQLEQKADAKILAPTGVVPFAIGEPQAELAMRQWLGQGFWRPGDLARTASVVGMKSVFVPYWVFAAETHTYWTADSSQTPPGARGDWYPLSGEHRGNYAGLLVGASGALAPSETRAICPFDLAAAVPPSQVDLDNVTAEQFSVNRKYARPLARQGLEELERAACSQYVPGSVRNMKVNTRIENLNSQPMLLPVWIMAYRYQERVYRFLVNGQTGKATGKAPISMYKVLAAVGIALAVVLLVLLLAGVGRGAAPAFPTSHLEPATSLDRRHSESARFTLPSRDGSAAGQPFGKPVRIAEVSVRAADYR
jgi:hypothetical protein